VKGHPKGGTQLPHEVDVVAELRLWEFRGEAFAGVVEMEMMKNRVGRSGGKVMFRHTDEGVTVCSESRLKDESWCRTHGIRCGAADDSTGQKGLGTRMWRVARKMVSGGALG
jgi:hypothetical protein